MLACFAEISISMALWISKIEETADGRHAAYHVQRETPAGTLASPL